MQSPPALWCHQCLPELRSVASNAALTAAVQASASLTHVHTHTLGRNLGTTPLNTQQVLGQDRLPNRTNRMHVTNLPWQDAVLTRSKREAWWSTSRG